MAAGSFDTHSMPIPEWNSDSLPLKAFLSSREIPNMVRITKGHYMNIGVSKFPLTRMHQEVFFHSAKTCVKILAHSLKRTEGRKGHTSRIVALDHRLSIPITYLGWFEMLSEDGKTMKPIETVAELAKGFTEKCLVRQKIKGYLVNSDGKLTLSRTKVIPAGEQLRLSGDITITSPATNSKMKLLRCTDAKGESIYLKFDQKGLFSPIAPLGGITGVYTMRDIVTKYRLPLTVKLVQGVWPKVDSSRFTGIIRLDWVYTDETAFVCPLVKDQLRVLPLPTDIPLQLCPARNFRTIAESESYKQIEKKCKRMVSNYNNTIHLIVSLPEVVVKNRNNRAARNMLSNPAPEPFRECGGSKVSRHKEDRLFDEIDDLYQYVRDGTFPPKSSFAYDSDEESYWEEPAYEPIDEFRQRVAALESGRQVRPGSRYQPADASKLDLLPSPEESVVLTESSGRNGVALALGGITQTASSTDPPPPVPPRRYARSGSVPAMQTHSNNPFLVHSKSERRFSKDGLLASLALQDSSSGSSAEKLSKEFENKSSNSSSGNRHIKKKIQTMYL